MVPIWFSALVLLFVAAISVDALSLRIYTEVGGSVTLPCSMSASQGSVTVDWFDYVHNNETDPIGVRSRIKSSSDYRSKFQISPQNELYINRIQLEDAGNYICITRSKSSEKSNAVSQSYVVTVYSAPQCFGVTSLRENETTEVTCNSTFVGELNPLKMQWFHRHANTDIDVPVASRDRFDIRVAQRSVVVPPVSYRDDGAVYTCRMMMDQVIECHVKLDVAHTVRDIELTPVKEVYEVGEEIRCSASGNPRPSVIIRPATGSGKTGAGSASVFVPESWLNGPQPVGLSCTASNIAFGKETIVAKNITFNVVAAASKKNEKAAKTLSAGSSVPIIAGIVIGVVILFAILLAVVCMRICKDRKAAKAASKTAPSTGSHKQELLKNDNGKEHYNH